MWFSLEKNTLISYTMIKIVDILLNEECVKNAQYNIICTMFSS